MKLPSTGELEIEIHLPGSRPFLYDVDTLALFNGEEASTRDIALCYREPKQIITRCIVPREAILKKYFDAFQAINESQCFIQGLLFQIRRVCACCWMDCPPLSRLRGILTFHRTARIGKLRDSGSFPCQLFVLCDTMWRYSSPVSWTRVTQRGYSSFPDVQVDTLNTLRSNKLGFGAHFRPRHQPAVKKQVVCRAFPLLLTAHHLCCRNECK